MEPIIERISRGQFWDFHGGIHPPEQKTQTSSKPIKQLGLPKQLVIPLQQHIGLEGELLVSVGDKVLKGQQLTRSTNPMEVPIHAPTSGIISMIGQSVIAHPSGLTQLCITLDVDGLDTWRAREVCSDITTLSNHEIVEKIADGGISGMGGAGFPTHIKANCKPDINFLIINGAECEPYITADDLLMMEQSDAIVDGIKILDRLLSPAFILIAIEDNKPRAIEAMKNATATIEKIKVCVVPTKYPTGGEKQLIQILTGKEVPAGKLPIHDGIIMQNVATCFAINEAVRHDTPLIRRVVTVTGQALNKPQNVWALLGTPVQFLLEQCEAQVIEDQKQPVIMGGPMMGFSISNDLVPIVKTSNCILVPSQKEMPSAFEKDSSEVECIRCGQCSDVCPSQLLPQELQWSAKAKDHPQLTKLNLSDCIECGACAYVCPSQIPLVHYYRIAKAEIREQQQLDLKAEKAKSRFEARKIRLEKEKIARQEKHKKAAAARKAAMNKSTPEAAGAKSAVAAALARVKAKKASQGKSQKPVDTIETANNSPANEEMITDQKSQVAAAIARAKAKKKQKEASTNSEPTLNTESTKSVESAESAVQPTSIEKSDSDTTNSKANESSDIKKGNESNKVSGNDKKAKIAAAIAKAKAKAKKLNKIGSKPEDKVKVKDSDKAASVTKVKEVDEPAETQKIKSKTDSEDSNSVNASTKATTDKTNVEEVKPALDKKAKIAAAIAKAKAKKLQKEITAENAVNHKENNEEVSG